VRIVLADDHRLVVEAIQSLLSSLDPEIEVVQAANFSEAIKKLAEENVVDLVVLDLNMPGMNGVEGIRIMGEKHPQLPVVILSGQASAEEVREVLQAGARGFIPKDLGGKGMLRALELVLSGEIFVPAMALEKGVEDVKAGTGAGGKFSPENPLSHLTPRERQVLSLLIEGQSNKAIADRLGLKPITAAFHVRGIFRKLNVANRTEAVITAIKLGWNV
jgi:two-component system nitrate/nitrite response regulator NarL